MPGHRHSIEEKIQKVEEGRGLLAGGAKLPEVLQSLGITHGTWFRWTTDLRLSERVVRPPLPPTPDEPQSPKPAPSESRERALETLVADLLLQIRDLQTRLGR